jgi:hypothetical protein
LKSKYYKENINTNVKNLKSIFVEWPTIENECMKCFKSRTEGIKFHSCKLNTYFFFNEALHVYELFLQDDYLHNFGIIQFYKY